MGSVGESGETAHMTLIGLTPAEINGLLTGNAVTIDGASFGLDTTVTIFFCRDSREGVAIINGIAASVGFESAPGGQFTCCETHAAMAGVPYNPLSGMKCPPDASGLT
jgi:hypothetical protein